jgi:MFS family permease
MLATFNRLRRRGFGLPVTNADERNIRHLYHEVFWAGIANAVVTFNGVFAVRLGASDALIGALNSIPPLIVALLTLPAGQWLERRTRQLPLIVGTIFLYRLGFLLIALMPFVVMDNRALVFVGIVLLMTIPTSVFGVGFSSMLAEIVPEHRRAEVVAWRNIILVATTAVVTYLAGRGLDAVIFPMNYQALFFISFVAALIALFWLARIEVPEAPPSKADHSRASSLTWSGIRMLLGSHPGYPRIIVDTLVYGIGPWMAAPLYTILYVRTLGASNSWIGLLTTIISLTGIAGYFLWQKGIARWGDRRVLAWTAIATGLYPGLVSLSPSLTPILVLGAVYGLVSPGLNLSHFSTLLKVCPADRRPSAIAFYTMIMYVGAFVSPLIAVALAELIGVRTVLFIGAAFWMAGGLLFLFYPPDTGSKPGEPDQEPV